MSYWLINILCVFVACIFLTGVLIPQILLIAFRRQLFDSIDERKIHKGAVPRLGGIAFEPVIFFSLIGAVGVNLLLGYDCFPQAFVNDAVLICASFCSLQLLYLTGMADDLIGIKYRAKFVVQIICAIFLIAGGMCFYDLDGILGIGEWPLWIAIPFTIVVTVFLVNAINLIDGIDGLASGLSSIATIIYGVSFYLLGEYILSTIAFATLGVLIPFYYYNVFGNAEKHSKIFMGDTGSLTVGLILALLGTKLFCMDKSVINVDPAVLAFSPLIVPCFDVVRVYIFRIRHHTNPFTPDKNHIHHRLLAAGFSQRTAMVTIVLTSMMLCVFNIALSQVLNINFVIIIDIVAWIAIMYILQARIDSRKTRESR